MTQITNKPEEHEDVDLLLAVYGGKAFLKVYQALSIGQIKFSFVNKENTKECIDCYMDAEDFACDFIDIIDNGELRNRAAKARIAQRESGAKYADNVWESRVGIAKSDQLRKFVIQPGSAQEFAFRATQGTLNITVGFSFRELKLLSYRWHFLESDWNNTMKEKYSLKNMTSQFRLEQNKKQYNTQKAEEINTAGTVPSNNKPIEKPVVSKPVSSSDTSQNKSTQYKIMDLKVKIKTAICDMENGGKAFQGWGQDNVLYNIVVQKELLSQTRIQNMLRGINAGAICTIKGAFAKDNLFYVA